MTKMYNFLSMLVLFLATGAALASTDMDDFDYEALVPANEALPPDDLAPYYYEHYDFEISPEDYEYAKKCGEKMSEKCGEKIFVAVFLGQKFDDDCCGPLMAIGKRCHHVLIMSVLSIPPLGMLAPKALPTSNAIWNHCASIAGPMIPSPSPSRRLLLSSNP